MIKTIKADLVTAMKEKNELKKSVLRMLIALLEKEKVEFKLETIDQLTKEQIITVIGRMSKALDKEIEEYQKVNRTTEVQESEKLILGEYLPKQLTTDEINAEVVHALDLVDKGELADVNKAKGYLAQKLKGKADMAKVMGALAKYSK